MSFTSAARCSVGKLPTCTGAIWRCIAGERGKARPVVDVDQDGTVGLRKGEIAPKPFEPGDGRGLERERLEPVLTPLGPRAGEARVRAVPAEEPAVGHPVELHHR